MSGLIDVGLEAIAIQDALVENLGELTPELEAKLDALLANGAESLDSAAWVVRKLTADAEACKEESLRYENRAKSFMAQVDYLKGKMLFAVDAAFNGKIKTSKNTIWGQTSAPHVGFEVALWADIAKIAEENSVFVRKQYSLDKTALKQYYENGEPLPAEIQVTELPGTRFLRIK